jgi:uncharacterized protein (TIGR03437 family)
MKPMSRYLLYAVLAAAASTSLFAQPVVSEGGIVNAASGANPRLPSGGVAQGSLFVIYGVRMGPAVLAASPLPWPTTLSGTSVRVTSGSVSADCPIYYTSAGQVAAVMPSNIPVGNATLTLSYNGQASPGRTVRVAANSFGIYTTNLRGSGPGSITNFESATSQPVNSPLRSARPGQTLIAYGTGLGALPSGANDGAPVSAATPINQAGVELYIGGRRADVGYAGRAPSFASLDQINFVVPAGVSGCAVPVYVKTGDIVSNFATISIAVSGSICSDALGLPQSQLEKLNSTGSLKVGNITLGRFDLEISAFGFNTSIKTDSGTAGFFDFTTVSVSSSSSLNAGRASSLGTCTVFSGTASALTPIDFAPPRGLDAGALINISGPKGAKSLKKVDSRIGEYSETLSTGTISIPGLGGGDGSYLDPGPYSFNNAAGGADVRGFTANLNLSAPVLWSNKAAVTNVNRASGQTINWTGGDNSGYVVIYGYSATDTTDNAILSIFSCTERASVGTFTVPAAILLALPPTPTASSSGLPFGLMGVGSGNLPATFSAPGLDYGYIVSTSLTLKSVNYQ